LLREEGGLEAKEKGNQDQFESSSSNQDDDSDRCYFCKKPGHVKKDCRNYKA